MEITNYIIEIYLSEDNPELVAKYESSNPFSPFSIGDVIKANTLNSTDIKETLIVNKIQQHIYEIGNSLTQQVAIYANK